MINHIKNAFHDLESGLSNFICENKNLNKIEKLAGILAKSFKEGKKVLIAGNGGSLCDAIHFAEEFTGRFRKEREALPVISLSNSAHITCTANDMGFANIFSRSVEAFGQDGDTFIGLSTSGNSTNIINAFNTAKEKKMYTVALLGKGGGKLKGVADIEWIIEGKTSDRIQEIHMAILHILIEITERHLFPENY